MVMFVYDALSPYLDFVGDFVRAWSSDIIPDEHDPKNGEIGSWYLSPKQHGVEFIVTNIVFVLLFRFFYNRAFKKDTPADQVLVHAVATAPSKRSKLDFFLLSMLFASISLITYHKYVRNAMVFMLQPCHVSMISLITILLMNPQRKSPHIAFNIYLHTQWGTLLALFFPDLRGYDLPFEIENFWIEHLLLVIAPVMMIFNNRLAVLPLSFDIAFVSFVFKATYHSLVLAIVSLYTGRNLNYMLTPPPGPVETFGLFYRPMMYVNSFILTILTRYVLVTIVTWALPRRVRKEYLEGDLHGQTVMNGKESKSPNVKKSRSKKEQ